MRFVSRQNAIRFFPGMRIKRLSMLRPMRFKVGMHMPFNLTRKIVQYVLKRLLRTLIKKGQRALENEQQTGTGKPVAKHVQSVCYFRFVGARMVHSAHFRYEQTKPFHALKERIHIVFDGWRSVKVGLNVRRWEGKVLRVFAMRINGHI